ncbi:MAG: P-II family nitrogen regulator [Allisonella histaminiformans]|uniref:Nitrogen regulatory protein P-II family n=1 Tax=Allisonella histaminiformans TaxID=209880 RepID=A0A1G5VZE7_9FIRM|nr:P-II family nitrogen regulator [Allisonella histaminiformans]MDY3957652.1 P-II family nitrogen regulator [Allisonella histaminiformans]MDY4540324.1 P-II family nitrogen regulator [Allisonella histaminiformans]PWL47278.1 MAG: P-II family nitrogen regulator [Veillonellaceae bacterium]SDA51118.1 nitrogen regulatory protein P-II family [Allisonella histaminiformans]
MDTEKKIYKVDAVIRPEKLEELKDRLYAIGVTGITVSDVYGCGLTHGQEEIYRGNVLTVNLLPKVKVEIVIYETPLEKLIDTIRDTCNTGHVGDGKIFVSELLTAIKIRTGERGGDAIIDDKA